MGKSLFEEDFTIEALSNMGNPLEQLSSLVDFEMFRPALEEVLVRKDCKTPAGRPQIDVVLMFKVIFLQRYAEIHLQMVVRLIFLTVFVSPVGHMARYAPSSRYKASEKLKFRI